MGRHLRNATAIRVNNFNADRNMNPTCMQFNGGTMFESEQGVFVGFGGNSTNTDGTFAFASVPQGFSRASGRAVSTKVSTRGSADRIAVKPIGGVGRQVASDGDCGQRCGSAYPNSYTCPDGCTCDGKGRGTCVSSKSRKGQIALANQRKTQGQGGTGGVSEKPRTTICPCECGDIPFTSSLGRAVDCETMCDRACNKSVTATQSMGTNFGGGAVSTKTSRRGSADRIAVDAVMGSSRNFGGSEVYARNFGGNDVFGR